MLTLKSLLPERLINWYNSNISLVLITHGHSMKKKIFIFLFLLFISFQQVNAKTINIDDTVALGIQNNPKIQAVMMQTGLSDADIKEAGMRFNPKLYLDATFGENSYKGGFEQTFELGGKRVKRVAVAKAQKEVLMQEIATEIINLRRDIRLAYIKLFAAKERLKNANEICDLTKKLTDIAKKKEYAGQIAMIDVLQSEIVNLKAKSDIQTAQADVIKAFNELNNLTGCKLDSADDLTNPEIKNVISDDLLADNDVENIISALSEQAFQTRPELKRLQRSLEQTKRLEKLAKSEFVPNLTIAAGPDLEIKRDERPRKTDFGAFTTITMDIPIFNHGQAGVMRAKAQRTVYEKQLNDTKNQILLELKNCYADFVQTEKSLKIYQTELLPKSKDVLAKSEYSFKEGKSDILMSLNAQEAYIRIKTDYINTLENYYNSLGNLERAVGVNNENL